MATIMTLVEDGLLSLDDSVTKFYPKEFAKYPTLTLRAMMAHMSGFQLADDWIFDDSVTL